jgi:membrane associated rhomboid family serine protease
LPYPHQPAEDRMPDSWDFVNKKPERPSPPIMTYAIALLCIAVTLANWASGEDHNSPWYALGHLGWLPVESIWAGHYAPLLTSVFLHLSIFHILFNMQMFVQLGSVMELSMNPLHYALFLITSAIIGSGAEIALSGQAGAGISGVVYAMAGLMWAGRSQIPAWRPVMTRYLLNVFLIWGAFCVIGTWTGTFGVANGAHFGGLLYGFAVGFLLYTRQRRPFWALVLAAMLAVTVLSVTWMPWSEHWTFWKGTQEQSRGNYRGAIAWYEKSLRNEPQRLIAWAQIAACWDKIVGEARAANDKAALAEATRQESLAFRRMIQAGREMKLKPVEGQDEPDAQSPLEQLTSSAGVQNR